MKFLSASILIFAVLLVLTGCNSTKEKEETPAYSFEIDDIQGNNVSLSNEEPTLMFFMGSWCSTCIAGEDVLKQIQALYPEVQLITIDIFPGEGATESLAQFQKVYGGNWAHVIDEENQITQGYNVKQLEEMILVDKNQKEVFRAVNPSVDKLKDVLETMGVN